MYKITFSRLLLGLIPISKTYKVLSHAMVFNGSVYELLLEDETIIHIPTSKVDKVILNKEFQIVASERRKNFQNEKPQ